MEKCEDIWHTSGMKEVYALWKETVERLFGTAKKNHALYADDRKSLDGNESRAYIRLHESEKADR